MELRNLTPFMPISFESRDENCNDFGVVVAKGTFDLVDSRRLVISSDQEQFVLSDQYYGNATKTCIRTSSDLSPFKPATDVIVTANACSEGGVPREHWNVSVSIGKKQKAFTVTGPRVWKKKLGLMVATRIEPVSSVPIRYENAFGGSYQKGDDNVVSFEPNPVGTGFVPAQYAGGEVPVPQFLPLNKTELAYGEQTEVTGLGPIAPHWAPRNQSVGTCDLAWRKSRFPDLPQDFDFSFYNSASSGLALKGYADGTEKVQLLNLSEEGALVFGLPGIDLASLLRYQSGEMVPGPMPLDTIHIDCLKRKVYLTWRGVYPVHMPLRVLEIRAKSRFQKHSPSAVSSHVSVEN